MEQFVKGDLVVVPFPFSDLSAFKKRPALVLPESEIIHGHLNKESNIRPNRIFIAQKSIISYKIGHISHGKFKEVRDKIVSILDQ